MLTSFVSVVLTALVPFAVYPSASMNMFSINAAFTANGHTVYITKSQPGWKHLAIYYSQLEQGRWSMPRPAWFSGGEYRDTDPAVSPDGQTVVFASTRPPLGSQPYRYALYKAYVDGPKRGTVEPLPFKGFAALLYPSIAQDGTLFFLGVTEKTAHIYAAAFQHDTYGVPERVVLPDEAAGVMETDATIARDKRFIVFSSNRPDAVGRRDLYVSFNEDGTWCRPIRLPEPVNSKANEIATGLAPDDNMLYFASDREGSLRTYSAPIGPWLASAHAAQNCEGQ
jgi:Tol biopolymer transport system component